METKFNFNSQVCTDINQSKRLLTLGFKKETADCYWWQETDQYGDGNGKWHLEVLDTKEAKEHFEYLDKIFDEELFIPAWSLDRLFHIYLDGNVSGYWNMITFEWGILIDCIESRIERRLFNKKYLV